MELSGNRRNIDHWLILLAVIVTAIFSLSYRGILVSQAFAYGDLTLFPEQPGQLIASFLSSWNPGSLGHFEPASPLQLFIALGSFLIGGTTFQKLDLFVPAPLSAIAMYFFLTGFPIRAPSKVIASTMYSTSIFVFGEFAGGGWTLLWVYALSPIVLLFWFKLQETKSLRDLSLLMTFSGILYSIYSHSLFIVGPFIFVSSIITLLSDPSRRRICSLSLIAWSSISIIFYLPYFESPSYFLALVHAGSRSAGQTGLGTLGDVTYTYSPFSSLLNILTLQNVLLPIALFSVVWAPPKIRRVAMGFSVVLFATILFIWLTATGITLPLFARFSLLFVFENPVKPIAIMFLAAIPLVATSIDSIWNRFANFRPRILGRRQFGFRFLAGAFLLVLALTLYTIPVLSSMETGDLGLSASHKEGFIVPDNYNQIWHWLQEKSRFEGFFRTLWLPQTADVLLPSLTIDPYSFSLPGGSVRYGLPSVDYVQFVLTHLVKGDISNTSSLLGMASVKYIIVNTASVGAGSTTVANYADTYVAIGEPSQFIEVLDRDSGLARYDSVGPFLIYSNNNFEPRIAPYELDSYSKSFDSLVSWQSSSSTEFSFDSNNSGQGWHYYTDSEVSLSNTTFHSSPQSLKLSNNRGSPSGGWVVAYRTIPVTGGREYRVSYWMKVANVVSSHIKAIFYDSLNSTGESESIYQAGISQAVSGTKDWYYTEGFVTVPKNAVKMDLSILGGWSPDPSSPALTFVDDIEVSDGSFAVISQPTAPTNLNFQQSNPSSMTKFVVTALVNKPTILVLAESFDERWVATNSLGRLLVHVRFLGWANGFILDNLGNSVVTISLSSQVERNISLSIWASLWVALVALAFFGTRLKATRFRRLTRFADRSNPN